MRARAGKQARFFRAGLELLTVAEVAAADRLTMASGTFDGYALMLRAGAAVAAAALSRYPEATQVDVLCGPGNNGGDGYVAARLLAQAGVPVTVWADAPPRAGSDAARAAAECPLRAAPLSDYRPVTGSLAIDAIFGAGLTRPLAGAPRRAALAVREARVPALSIDLPSGLSGDTGAAVGHVSEVTFEAELTVTFGRRKPGHLLLPGRALCGEVLVADIGIADETAAAVGARCFANAPALWREALPRPGLHTHKYARGHVGVVSAGVAATGAARLAAVAAARAGAGAVTLLSPAEALAVNAAHLTSTILRQADSYEEIDAFLTQRRPQALVFGPGLGAEPQVAELGLRLLGTSQAKLGAAVFDAGAISAYADAPEALFDAAQKLDAPQLILTPHDGEFARLFPGLGADRAQSKLERAREAARRSGAVIVFKGPDTVIAAPDGLAVINGNGSHWLATAGSGDVLAGIVGSLTAQGMPPFEAACAAVWMHGEAALRCGPGLIAEDLPLALLPVLRELSGWSSGRG